MRHFTITASLWFAAIAASSQALAQGTPIAPAPEQPASDAAKQNKRYEMRSTAGFSAPDGQILTLGRGQTRLAGGVILTSNSIVKISKTSVQVGETTFALTTTTRFCLADGKKAALVAFAVGDEVTVTSASDEATAVTLRKGLAQLPMALFGGGGEPRNIDCK